MNESRVFVGQCAGFTELALSLSAGCTALVPLDADLTNAHSRWLEREDGTVVDQVQIKQVLALQLKLDAV